MNIPSINKRILPYVYKGTHIQTGQIYIGSRCANVKLNLPSDIDLGKKYFTSSKYIKQLGFHNFDWIIIAEFFNWEDAYDFEQTLISEIWRSDLCLNKRVQLNGTIKFCSTGSTKERNIGRAQAAIKTSAKLKGRTAKNNEAVARAQMKNRKLPPEVREKIVYLRDKQQLSFSSIYKIIIEMGYKIAYTSLIAMYNTDTYSINTKEKITPEFTEILIEKYNNGVKFTELYEECKKNKFSISYCSVINLIRRNLQNR
jgi:hypothetical protein